MLLFVGRLGKEKSVDTLIRALAGSRHAEASLLIVGDGPDRRRLERLAQDLRLDGRVKFAGYLDGDDLVAAYHLADAFVFASTTETQGLVLGEAMAAALPVIAVTDAAVADFVVDGSTGLLVPEHHEAFSRAIDTTLGDDELRGSMSEASLERASHFSIEVQAAAARGAVPPRHRGTRSPAPARSGARAARGGGARRAARDAGSPNPGPPNHPTHRRPIPPRRPLGGGAPQGTPSEVARGLPRGRPGSRGEPPRAHIGFTRQYVSSGHDWHAQKGPSTRRALRVASDCSAARTAAGYCPLTLGISTVPL